MTRFQIYKIPSTRYWQVRFKHLGKYIVRSLRTTSESQANEFATVLISKYLKHPHLNRSPTGSMTFNDAANLLFEQDQHLVDSGHRYHLMNKMQKSTLKVHFSNTLGLVPIQEINYTLISDFVNKMMDDKKSLATIKRNLTLLSKTLKYCHRMGWIQFLPQMPPLNSKSVSRSWISYDEYQKLLNYLIKTIETGRVTIEFRQNNVDKELRLFITFMINTFLRPSDVKGLKHKHIEVVNNGKTQYLRITTETSKTDNHPIISMPPCVPIYNNLIKFQKAKGYGKADHYLFMPQYENRTLALLHLRKQFQRVLEKIGLKQARNGQTRTLYSLRHSSIMFRLLQGRSIDLLTLARNARTSVEMLDKHYAKHLTAEMNVDILHSKR